MTADLDLLMAAMRSAGCRSSDERMRRTAVKRLATSDNYRERAAAARELARRTSDGFADLRPLFLEDALHLEVRGAERRGEIPRAVRDIALRLLPWAGDYASLVDTARLVAEPPNAHETYSAPTAVPCAPTTVDPVVSGPDPGIAP
ncbi:hypothetical protein [Microlunatus antarcticus]|uniref:Uncharacterized protein n=1 Tax=Microlunatus antarcticus TaxID=53388 RepID=A0A7W5JUM2_9ACTN|nr:hypothetical protein [Microlunatus antarcticus]MBB3326563.1 hypothetical protein [Microlunatus antarcticus]